MEIERLAPRLRETTTQAQRYLKWIKYGNSTPFGPGGWLFEVVLDYGDPLHNDTLAAAEQAAEQARTRLRMALDRREM